MADKYLRGASRRSLLQQFGAAAIGISFAGGLSACGRSGGRTVSFYNWDTYIGPTTLADFEEATGAAVNMSLFATNDELFARLRAGNPGYDVIVPSNEFVTRMSQAQMIQQLDRAQIPNFSNLAPEFQDAPFDPGRQYSVPYTWLTLGIAYRKSAMPRGFVPDSWRYLFDSPQFSQRIAVLSESADLIRLCAKYKGHSLNNIPAAMLSEIEQMLIRQKPHIKAFHEDDGQDLLVAGEVDLVLEYCGDIAQIVSEHGAEQYGWVIPREGTLLNQDCLCIPSGAPNVADAHAFINYLLDADAGSKITAEIQYPTPNAAARALMPDTYKNNPIIFPTPEIMAISEYGAFEGDERSRLYEEIFTRISAA
ncbi:MAG: PotD/PotF family extracellular solute-binding protein [Hyphomonadaceae bacterium]